MINPAFMHGTLRVLPREVSPVPREVACDGNWLRGERSPLTAGEKSAEGIVGEGNRPRREARKDELGTRAANRKSR